MCCSVRSYQQLTPQTTRPKPPGNWQVFSGSLPKGVGQLPRHGGKASEEETNTQRPRAGRQQCDRKALGALKQAWRPTRAAASTKAANRLRSTSPQDKQHRRNHIFTRGDMRRACTSPGCKPLPERHAQNPPNLYSASAPSPRRCCRCCVHHNPNCRCCHRCHKPLFSRSDTTALTIAAVAAIADVDVAL